MKHDQQVISFFVVKRYQYREKDVSYVYTLEHLNPDNFMLFQI